MKKYAVIGNPISHSLSPAVHNAAFKELSVDANYKALEVERLERSFDFLKDNFAGINVTIPHKLDIIDMVDEKEMMVDAIGAANCVSFEGGSSRAYNTDVSGAITALKSKLPKLKNKEVLVLGAGGASRAVVYGLAMEGAKISLWNRTFENAKELSGEVCEKVGVSLDLQKEQDLDGFNAIINTTSLGMYPKVDDTPLTSGIPSKLQSSTVVMDIVYNPLETRFLKEAGAAGLQTIDGLSMFIGQAADSLRIWGYEPPVELMRKAALEGLNRFRKR